MSDYLGKWAGNLERDGVYLESFMYGQHAMKGYSSVIGHVARYFAAIPPTTAQSRADLSALESKRIFAHRGHYSILSVQQPNGQFPANGDNNVS